MDHKPNSEEERINALGGYVTNDNTRRINGLLAVGRAIGDFFMSPFVTADPYINEYSRNPDGNFFFDFFMNFLIFILNL